MIWDDSPVNELKVRLVSPSLWDSNVCYCGCQACRMLRAFKEEMEETEATQRVHRKRR